MSQVVFPVYRLPSKPSEDGGVSFFLTENTENETFHYRIIDDLNKPGKTLADRRMRLLIDKVKLFEFKLAVFSLGDLIRLSDRGCYWIDATGKIFHYLKSKNYKILNRKITSIKQHNTYWIFEVEGLPSRFTSIMGPPGASYDRALILEDKLNHVFYGFTDGENTKIKRRMV